MNAGDAYEQVMKVAIEGSEITLKILGEGAEKMAMWIAALLTQNQNKPSVGKTNLMKMLKEGQPLKVVSLQKADLQPFAMLAKNYGIPFTPVENTEQANGMLDVLVREGDADKINLIFERLAAKHMQEQPEKNEFGAPPQSSLIERNDKLLENQSSESRPGESVNVLPLPEREVFALPAGEYERVAQPPQPIAVFIYDKEKDQMIAVTPEMIRRYEQKMREAAATREPVEVLPLPEREVFALPAGDYERMAKPPTPIPIFIYNEQSKEMMAVKPEMISRDEQATDSPLEPVGDEAPLMEDIPPFLDDDAPPIEDIPSFWDSDAPPIEDERRVNDNRASRQPTFSKPEERPSVKEKLDRAKADIRQQSRPNEPQRGQRRSDKHGR